jgi:hypothetical protein
VNGITLVSVWLEVLSKDAGRFRSKGSICSQCSQILIHLKRRVELQDGFGPEIALFQASVCVLVNAVVNAVIEDANETANVAAIFVDHGFSRQKNV